MFKRFFKPTTFIALTVALIVTLVPIIGTTAAPEYGPGNPPTPEFAKDVRVVASLREINGSRMYELSPVLLEAIAKEDGSYRLTFEVGVPTAILQDEASDDQSVLPFSFLPFTAYAHGDSLVTRCDSTASACATVTLNYVIIGVGPKGSEYGYYQNTKTIWTRSDPAVTWSNAIQGAQCDADWYSKTGRCLKRETMPRGNPTSGTTYTFTPSFAGSSNKLYIGPLDGILGDEKITLKRGSSTWTFTFCVAAGFGRFGSCDY